MQGVLEKAEKYIIYVIVFLIPVFLLTVFTNSIEIPKLTILAFGVALVLLLKAIRTIIKGSLDIYSGYFDFPILLLAAAYLASAIISTPNKMEAFLLPGTATLIIAGALLYYLINQLDKPAKKCLETALFVSGAVGALMALLARLGVFEAIPQLPAVIRNRLFTPFGGNLSTIIFLTSLLPLGIGLVFKQKDTLKKALYGVSLAILVLGLSLSLVNVLPGKDTTPRLLDFRTSWFVTVDTLKNSPIWGIGPGNYLTAFNRFRPLSYNQSDLWAFRSINARNFYMTLITETGLVGAAGIILLLVVVLRAARNKLASQTLSWDYLAKNTALISLVILVVLLAFFASTIVLITLLFVLLGLSTEGRKLSLNLSAQTEGPEKGPFIASRLPAILVTTPVIVAILLFGYYSSRALVAEAKFKKALDALIQNRGTETYNLMIEAIGLNPRVDRYHASYSQVNLGLADSIAGQPELTDQDRATIARLIQQAIREGKTTVALNPQRAGNWELLARTYQTMIPLAEGSDVFAIQTFNQAVVLDPINPNLRIALGGVHYALGNYDTAIRVLELAVLTKADLANAHFNLAAALRENGDIQRAINEMSIVLSLVDRDSNDYQLAKTELENLEQRLPSEEVEATETLTPPQPAEEPVIVPPIELPEEAEPPEAPEEPTPTPTATPTPTP